MDCREIIDKFKHMLKLDLLSKQEHEIVLETRLLLRPTLIHLSLQFVQDLCPILILYNIWLTKNEPNLCSPGRWQNQGGQSPLYTADKPVFVQDFQTLSSKGKGTHFLSYTKVQLISSSSLVIRIKSLMDTLIAQKTRFECLSVTFKLLISCEALNKKETVITLQNYVFVTNYTTCIWDVKRILQINQGFLI